MTLYADWLRWIARCRDRPGSGVTAGDTMHSGLGSYDCIGAPCPNGLPIDRRTPDQVPAWRERIERARRDIADWQRELRVADTAAGLTVEDVSQFIEEVRKWVKSRRWQVVGSTESKPAGNG